MESSSSLSFLLTLPLVGMVIALLIPKGVQRIYAIFSSLLYFILVTYESAGLIFSKSTAAAEHFVVEHKLSWIPEIGINLNLRLDTTSAWFVVLSALVGVIAFSTKGIWYRKHPKVFTAMGFFLMFALNAAFLSSDLITFYLAYEAVFIPMIFMVGIWGESRKATSVFRFFLMSFLGSILMLVSIFYLSFEYAKVHGSYSSQVTDLLQTAASLPETTANLVFLGFFAAFAIKVPLVPFHGWLKDVYTHAPMPGTIWMSAILSKLGVFGIIRFVLPLFPGPLAHFQGWLLGISAASVIYPALLAIRSPEPKALLAYSSISHLGFVMLGVFSLRAQGSTSAILLSVGHTLASGLMFFLLGQVEERHPELTLVEQHGLARKYPLLFTALFIGVLASVSLPGTLNFVGEFMVLISSYPVSALCTILAAVGVILGAVYMLKFYQKLGLGGGHSKEHPAAVQAKDLGGYELMLTVFLISILVVGGFQTAVFLKGN